jgi:hypothetical protein
MKSILHNWDDERCSVILGRCRSAMPAHAHLLVVERIMPERISGSPAERAIIRSDLNMLVALGGRERTLAQFTALLASAGFAVKDCKPVGFGFSVLEAAGD